MEWNDAGWYETVYRDKVIYSEGIILQSNRVANMRFIPPIFPSRSPLNSHKFRLCGLRFPITRLEEAQAIRYRDSCLRRGAMVARISALPLFLIGSTGWIPNEELLAPKGSWPWGAVISLFLIVVSLVGIFCRREKSSKRLSQNSLQLPS